jgi:hypothetical protein
MLLIRLFRVSSIFVFLRIIWASRFAAPSGRLASGYPLHHLRAFHALRWFRYYPSRFAHFVREICISVIFYFLALGGGEPRPYIRRL